MKILFLDIDGVVNCEKTAKALRPSEALGIDPYMALLVNRICEATGAQIVLSSSWRLWEESRKLVEEKIFPKPIDVTPWKKGLACRGCEIKEWLDINIKYHDIENYAILDDNTDFHNEQKPNFFKTAWDTGLTEEIAQKVIIHLNKTDIKLSKEEKAEIRENLIEHMNRQKP